MAIEMNDFGNGTNYCVEFIEFELWSWILSLAMSVKQELNIPNNLVCDIQQTGPVRVFYLPFHVTTYFSVGTEPLQRRNLKHKYTKYQDMDNAVY